MMEKPTYTAYTDGGSRGNPGPSASAYLIQDRSGEIVLEGGQYMGVGTNNRAEYNAVLLALGALSGVAGAADTVEFKIDSLLVVNQLSGVYKVRNRELWPVHEQIVTKLAQFKDVHFTHVPRELNVAADARVNKILDAHAT